MRSLDRRPDLHAIGNAAPLGIGHITATAANTRIWHWWTKSTLPLYGSPDGDVWGWLVDGQVVLRGSGEAWAALVLRTMETDYERLSVIVSAVAGGAWFAIERLGPWRDHGPIWVHRCHLAREDLRFEPWSERLLSDRISPLVFRARVPHWLRAGPGKDHEKIRLIPSENYHMEPRQIRGDWMQVSLTIPSDYCAGENLEVERNDGWVKWRGPLKGPWVWYFTRGC